MLGFCRGTAGIKLAVLIAKKQIPGFKLFQDLYKQQ
jgi:hypothetical protein